MKKTKKKPAKKAEFSLPTNWFLTICKDCRIRLVVKFDRKDACLLCESRNLEVSLWR